MHKVTMKSTVLLNRSQCRNRRPPKFIFPKTQGDLFLSDALSGPTMLYHSKMVKFWKIYNWTQGLYVHLECHRNDLQHSAKCAQSSALVRITISLHDFLVHALIEAHWWLLLMCTEHLFGRSDIVIFYKLRFLKFMVIASLLMETICYV